MDPALADARARGMLGNQQELQETIVQSEEQDRRRKQQRELEKLQARMNKAGNQAERMQPGRANQL